MRDTTDVPLTLGELEDIVEILSSYTYNPQYQKLHYKLRCVLGKSKQANLNSGPTG